MEDDNNNKIVQDEPGESYEFKYNFVNTPWDDRTLKSKVGIVTLLIAIFTATMACVIHNLITHFDRSSHHLSEETNCNLVKVDEYKYVARIHLVETQELLCVGAVLSLTSVLANSVCTKSGPIRMRLGSPSDPRCKKGFSVDVLEPVNYEGVLSKLVLLSSYENMAECVQTAIKVGNSVNWKSQAYIIGRPLRGGRSLSRQPANLVDLESQNPGFSLRNPNIKETICVMDLGKCPVRAGDLLVQNGYLIGLASTSNHAMDQSKLACFADIRVVRKGLNNIDSDIISEK
ncbi:uncharacterized protein LOC114352212 [Ostrinia furnacalis]|uniref:uncharacterized protein LOC114352212 n=1 Tax=Ostrinia furnacalis TaxID=93504 RepID=UPI00103A3E6F|nr:uncharacterized protein LOC114352212 [Ostrinia furnacalis]